MLPLLISAAVVLSMIASPPAGHGVIPWEACHGVTFSLPSSWTAEEKNTADSCNVHLYPKSWKKTVKRAKVVLQDQVFWLIITPHPPTEVALSRQFDVAEDHWVLAPGTIDSQEPPLLRRNGWVGVVFETRGGNRTYKQTYGGGNAGVVFYHHAIVGTDTVTAEILESEPYYYPELFDVLLKTLRFSKSVAELRQPQRRAFMSTIEVGELLYEYTLKITGLKEYGVSFGSLMAGEVAPPPEGARFDVVFDGASPGPKLKGKVTGVDFLRIRADGRFQLHIHANLTADDGQTIALEADGVALARNNSSIADLRENVTLFASSKDYTWVNALQVWGIGTVDLAEQIIQVKGYSA